MPEPHVPIEDSPLSTQTRELLRELMQEQHVSFRELAERSGVHKSMITRILSGERSPTLRILDRLFQGLGHQAVLELHDL